MNEWREVPIFKDNMSTLKETSLDDSNLTNPRYMTESGLSVVNFDNVKRDYLKNISCQDEALSSVDALLLANDNVLIEFKNGDIRKREARLAIHGKIQNSLLLLCDITDNTISTLRDTLDFILVYNESKNPVTNREYISQRLNILAQQKVARFSLDNYRGVYFRRVHTYTEKEFAEYLHNLAANTQGNET